MHVDNTLMRGSQKQSLSLELLLLGRSPELLFLVWFFSGALLSKELRTFSFSRPN